ncbi:MAG: general stress protein CsbD [Bacteroidia bacterium]|nr:general stress protein CsbD [Bacteroidia bacterium]
MNTKLEEESFIEKNEKLDEKVFLTKENDLQQEELKNDERLEKLQARLGKSKEEIKKIINALHSS